MFWGHAASVGGDSLVSPHVTMTEIVVRPNDMDADRNVDNAPYFEYFHQARLEHLHRLGVYPSLRRDPAAGNFSWPRLRTWCPTFLAPDETPQSMHR